MVIGTRIVLKKAKKPDEVPQRNTVFGFGSIVGPTSNMIVGEASISITYDKFVTYEPKPLSTYWSHELLIDTGANMHIYADKTLFVSYQQAHERTMTTGNASAAQVCGIGNMDLKFTSGCVLSLTRVLHVPYIRRNIISGSCLVKDGFQLLLKCNKVVVTYTGVFF